MMVSGTRRKKYTEESDESASDFMPSSDKSDDESDVPPRRNPCDRAAPIETPEHELQEEEQAERVAISPDASGNEPVSSSRRTRAGQAVAIAQGGEAPEEVDEQPAPSMRDKKSNRATTTEQKKAGHKLLFHGKLPDWNQAMSTEEIAGDPFLAHATKFEALRSKIKLKTVVSPVTPFPALHHELMNLPTLRTVTLQSKGQQETTITVQSQPVDVWRLRFDVAGSDKELVFKCPKRCFPETKVGSVQSLLCQLWSRCPVAVDHKILQDLLLDMVLRHLDDAEGSPRCLPFIEYQKPGSTVSEGRYFATMKTIDPITAETKRTAVSIAPSLIDDLEIPDLPVNVLFKRHVHALYRERVAAEAATKRREEAGEDGEDGEDEEDEEDEAEEEDDYSVEGRPDVTRNMCENIRVATSAGERPRHEAAIKVLRLLQYQRESRVVDIKDFKAAAKLSKSQY